MSWFRKRPPPPAIPRFEAEPKLEPRVEPMEVIEVRDPTDSMVLRIKDLIKIRFK